MGLLWVESCVGQRNNHEREPSCTQRWTTTKVTDLQPTHTSHTPAMSHADSPRCVGPTLLGKGAQVKGHHRNGLQQNKQSKRWHRMFQRQPCTLAAAQWTSTNLVPQRVAHWCRSGTAIANATYASLSGLAELVQSRLQGHPSSRSGQGGDAGGPVQSVPPTEGQDIYHHTTHQQPCWAAPCVWSDRSR